MKTKYELNKRLEFLMRIGLVDRTKLQQYKLAFKDPDNNVKFQIYREKILEVFFKIFDIIDKNDPIFERVRQQVILRYRNQRPMKKSLREAAPKKPTREQRGRQSRVADFRKKMASLELNNPSEIHKIHHELTHNPPKDMHHRERVAKLAIAAASKERARKAERTEKLAIAANAIKDSKSDIEKIAATPHPPINTSRFDKPKPTTPVASYYKPKEKTKQDEVDWAYQSAHKAASDKEHHASKTRGMIGKLIHKMRGNKTPEEMGHEAGLKAAKIVADRHRKLKKLGEEEELGLATKIYEMAIGQSGGQALRSTKNKAEMASNAARRRQEQARSQAQQRQNQAKADANRQRATQERIRDNSKGQPTT